LQPNLVNQELQTSNYIKTNINIPFISLLSYLRADCHKQAVTHIRESRRLESMYNLQEKSDTHDTYASHASPRTPLIRFLRAVPVRGNLSRTCQLS
jgi:hypothetical protein